MKTTYLFICLLMCFASFSQDMSKVNAIDSIVKRINGSNFTTRYDTLNLDKPDLGLRMKTYLTTVMDGNKLKKFVNHVNAITDENGQARKMISANSFYFDQDQLIKVEESIMDGEKTGKADWYYADDKPLYYTFKSERSEERALLLLSMAQNMLKQVQK